MIRVFVTLVCVWLSMSTLWAREYEPKVLINVLERVEAEVERGARPVVIFDLDETLIDTRPRSLSILREFGRSAQVRAVYRSASQILRESRLEDVVYHIEDIARDLGLLDSALVAQLKEYYSARYFSNEYLSRDRQIDGAKAYVMALQRAGALIVYLTGRDKPRMGVGTEYSLVKLGFPLGGNAATLLMKSDKSIDDTSYKTEAFATIAKWGTVVGAFENEPRNVNAMATAFPEAITVFLDTMHSNKPDLPLPSLPWVKDFDLR